MAVLVMLVAACGHDDAAPDDSERSTPASSTDAFPVTIAHQHGTTEIPEKPERVVSVGYSDPSRPPPPNRPLAVPVIPVGVRGWYGTQRAMVFGPWTEHALGDAEPVILATDMINFEQVKRLHPDVIVGLYSGMTDEEYATLSRIAPTIADHPEYEDFQTPWQEATRMIGQALGRSDRAEVLLAEVDDHFSTAAAEHPEFDGVEAVAAYSYEAGSYGVFGPDDARSQFLTSLGFDYAEDVTTLTGDEFYAELSGERLDVLDADIVVWAAADAEEQEQDLAANPVYRTLTAHREGRDVFLDESAPLYLVQAFSFNSVLSLSYAIDETVPLLAAAVDGGSHRSTD